MASKARPTKAKKSDLITDEQAILQLINTYTAKRDWFMVERLFNDLGTIYGEKAA